MKDIQARMQELIKYLESQYSDFNGSDVTISFNNRLTSTAGRAFLEEGRIELSTKLYNENWHTS